MVYVCDHKNEWSVTKKIKDSVNWVPFTLLHF